WIPLIMILIPPWTVLIFEVSLIVLIIEPVHYYPIRKIVQFEIVPDVELLLHTAVTLPPLTIYIWSSILDSVYSIRMFPFFLTVALYFFWSFLFFILFITVLYSVIH